MTLLNMVTKKGKEISHGKTYHVLKCVFIKSDKRASKAVEVFRENKSRGKLG